MNSKTSLERSSVSNMLMLVAASVIVVAGLRAAREIVVPFLLSVFFAVILTPPLRWLVTKGLPTWAALLLIAVFIALFGTGMLFLAGASLNDFNDEMPVYQTRLQNHFDRIRVKLVGAKDSRTGGSTDNGKSPSGLSDDEAEFSPLNPKLVMELVKRIVSELGNLFSSAVLILITVILMLLEATRLPEKLKGFLKSSDASRVRLESIVANIRRYMVIKTTTSLLTGALVCAWLLAVGVKYPILWGLLAFLLNYVPNIGSIIAAIPAVLVALVGSDSGVGAALATALGYVAINVGVGYFIEPRWMGKGLGLSTLVVFLSLVFWGWSLGPVGMLLSAPLTMVVKIVLIDYEETRWIAVLLGSDAHA